MTGPLKVSNFSVLPDCVDGHLCVWMLSPGETAVVDKVQLSYAPDFSSVLAEAPAAGRQARFPASAWRRVGQAAYFRLVAPGPRYSGARSSMSGDEEPRKSMLAAAIIRKEFVLAKANGIDALLFKQRIGEAPDGEAHVDPVTGIPVADAPGSLGTVYSAGYLAPLHFRFFRTAAKPVVKSHFSVQTQGLPETTTAETLTARVAGFPPVAPRDLIYDKRAGILYVAKEVDPTYFPGSHILVVQQVTGISLPASDNAYTLVSDDGH